MQSGKAVWPWVLGVVVVGGAGTWLFRDQLQHLADSVAVPEQSAPTSAVAVPKPAATQEPAPSPIKHPLDSEAAADPALPNLADSDAAAWSTLSGLFKGEGALTALLRDHLIQRLVTQVDNLDKASVPPTALAFRPLPFRRCHPAVALDRAEGLAAHGRGAGAGGQAAAAGDPGRDHPLSPPACGSDPDQRADNTASGMLAIG